MVRTNKKGNWAMVKTAGIILTLISFLVLLLFFKTVASNSDVDSSVRTCRGSMLLRANAGDVTGDRIARMVLPVMCKTHELVMPEENDYRGFEKSVEGATYNIAERIADCWWEFGEGSIEKDAFSKNGFFGKDKCMSCFTFTLDNLDKGESVSSVDLYDFMFETSASVKALDKDVCTGDDEIDEDDCVSEKASICERKGGECKKASGLNQIEYNRWTCKKNDEKCFIDKENQINYLEYIFLGEAKGVLLIDKEIKEFTQDEEYAISFVSDTSKLNIGGAAMIGAATAGGAGLAVALAFGPPGWIVGAVALGVGVATGVVATSLGDNINKDTQAVLITKLIDVEDYCNLQRGMDKR